MMKRSRKPVNEVRSLQTRAALWKVIRNLGTFTARELRRETCCSASQVDEYLKGLTAAGILSVERAEPGTFVPNRYRLEKDLGIDPPRVRRDGTLVTQGLGREQMWRTLRSLGAFTAIDLSVNATTEEAPVSLATAKEYCHFLARAGYLATVRKGKGKGKGGEPTLYRFVPTRFTGPLPPMIQRVKAVYDPNIGEVVWSEDPAGKEDDNDAE